MKWEYGFVNQVSGRSRLAFEWEGGQITEADLLPLLNRLGKEGWEVIQITRFGGEVAVLKRPLAE